MVKYISLSGYRYFLRHPLQALLSVLGIALGVSVIISIDIANTSSMKAFERSFTEVTGKATHKIISGPDGVNDSIYFDLKSNFDIPLAPVIERYVMTGRDFNKAAYFFGVDPFSEIDFRNLLGKTKSDFKNDISELLTGFTAVISNELAVDLNLEPGDTLSFMDGVNIYNLKVIAILNPTDSDPGYMIATDISTAQHIFGMQNRIDAIDLIINKKNGNLIKEIKEVLPSGVYLSPAAAREKINSSLVKGFSTNLDAMSLLALIVGMFLIYNTMTFSVVRRRNHIGYLRSIGATRREIFLNVLKESLILGIIGTVLGITAGIILGKGMLQLVSRSVNDLYFSVNAAQTEVTLISLLKGIAAGIIATLLASSKPAYEASSAPAKVVLYRSYLETSLSGRKKRLAVYGMFLVIAGLLFQFIYTKSIIASYAGIVPLIVGFSLMTPLAVYLLVRIFRPVLGKIFGTTGSLAAGGVTAHLSRTSIAIAALSISVAAAIGVGTMVSSFRTTVIDWLHARLKADIYISIPSTVTRFNDRPFEKEAADEIEQLPQIKFMNRYREFQIKVNNEFYHLLGAKLYELTFNTVPEYLGTKEETWDNFQNKENVLVSEPFSFRYNVKPGDSLEIPTSKGRKKFRISGIFNDFSSDIGLILISFNTIKKYWNDRKLSGLAIFTKDGTNVDSLITEINNVLGKNNKYIVRSNKSLINKSIKVFDRTFIITNVLQLLAICVAFVGILSSLMAIQLEKIKEFGILRAVGFTPGGLRKLIILQTGLIGLISGLLSLPLGNIMAAILTFAINKRSFGWSLNFSLMPELMLLAILNAVVAALFAGIYPAVSISKISPSHALREE